MGDAIENPDEAAPLLVRYELGDSVAGLATLGGKCSRVVVFGDGSWEEVVELLLDVFATASAGVTSGTTVLPMTAVAINGAV